jgi:hypothetical protein
MLKSLRRSPWLLTESHMIRKRTQRPTVPPTEPHGFLNRDIWFLQKILWFLLQKPTVPPTESHGSCNRDIWFMQQSHMVPATKTYCSCNRATWFLQQRHMVPAKDPKVPATEPLGVYIRVP